MAADARDRLEACGHIVGAYLRGLNRDPDAALAASWPEPRPSGEVSERRKLPGVG